MRIVGGVFAGRTLPGKPPDGTRPTADRVREAIASALNARDLMRDQHVLELYAGTGALGLEALSWGAARLIAVDDNPAALRCVRTNAEALGLSSEVVTTLKLALSAKQAAAHAQRIAEASGAPIGLVLADPPYAEIAALPPLLAALAACEALAPGAGIVIEHARKTELALPAGFQEVTRYRYGDTAVLLGRHA